MFECHPGPIILTVDIAGIAAAAAINIAGLPVIPTDKTEATSVVSLLTSTLLNASDLSGMR